MPWQPNVHAWLLVHESLNFFFVPFVAFCDSAVRVFFFGSFVPFRRIPSCIHCFTEPIN